MLIKVEGAQEDLSKWMLNYETVQKKNIKTNIVILDIPHNTVAMFSLVNAMTLAYLSHPNIEILSMP